MIRANRWQLSPTFREPAHRAFVLAAARYLWQKDIPDAFAIAFPGRPAPSHSAVSRLLVASTSPAERSMIQQLTAAEFVAGWLNGTLR